MAKYIDVDALVEKWQKELQKEPNKKNTLACKVFKLFIERLKSEPAADVEPVRHGKWVICCDGYYPYCTECGKERLMRLINRISEVSAEHENDEIYWVHVDRCIEQLGLEFSKEESNDTGT